MAWLDAKLVGNRLSAQRLPKGFSKACLPTEAQWEYACRAGTRTAFHFGDWVDETQAPRKAAIAYYSKEKNFVRNTVQQVGTYSPNALGLFDMHGNLEEFCLDVFNPRYYQFGPSADPFCDSPSQNRRIGRGGSVYYPQFYCRSAFRPGGYDPSYKGPDEGFRLAILAETIDPERPPLLDCTGPKGADADTVKRAQKQWADYFGVPVEAKVPLGGDVNMEFMLIPPGKFWMGTSEEEAADLKKAFPNQSAIDEQLANEQPLRIVTLTKPFYLGKFEVTNEEYCQLAGLKSSPNELGKRFPVTKVSWVDAKALCNRFTPKSLPNGFAKVCLPTEAQWEYACRAGTRTAFHFGDLNDETQAHLREAMAHFSKTKELVRKEVSQVGRYEPNALGLFDMHGNVHEHCLDVFNPHFYSLGTSMDPVCDGTAQAKRIYRGGSVYYPAFFHRSAYRNGGEDTNHKSFLVGFRPVILQ